MRLLGVFRKSLREQAREPSLLALALLSAPLFVLLYWVLFPSGSTTYGVLVLNQDTAVQTAGFSWSAGEQVIESLQGVTYANGTPLLKVTHVSDRGQAEAMLRDRNAALLLIVPPDFSRSLQAVQAGKPVTTTVVVVGDLTNPYYPVAGALSGAAVEQYLQAVTGQLSPVQIAEEPLGASAARSEFENYVPGLLVFAVLMLVFPVPMAVAREVEAGTLRRLQLTRMSSWDLLGGISAAQVLIGVTAVVLTVLTATVLGFRSQGPLWLAIVVGAVTGLSVVGVGLLVACFSRTVTEAFLIANLPLTLLMFFSGAIYPIPRLSLFTIAGRTFGLYDLLPPTHAVVALNKVLTMGAGLADVTYELTALLVLSLVYFAAGVWLFRRRHLRSQQST